MDTSKLGGIAALATLFIVGAVFGRLHGSDDARIGAHGDRVASGLLALPLIALCIRAAFPTSHAIWAIAAPIPVALYTVLLAGTEWNWSLATRHFTRTQVVGTVIVYVAMAVAAWMVAN